MSVFEAVNTVTDEWLLEGFLTDIVEPGFQLSFAAAAIRAADPQRAWHFIGMAPNSGSYPGLVADALERKFGGYLGLEKTDKRLVDALLSGAVKHALHIIEEEMEREIERRQRQQ